MSVPPLHLDPLRPILNGEGRLLNPIGRSPTPTLNDDEPVAYADLEPSTTYRTSGFEYLTDASAMPARVRGGLRLVRPEHRIRHRTAQRAVGNLGSGSEDRYHGGHVVAVSLGGFASGPNLFPQAPNFNVSAFARLESSWRQALREGHAVEVDIALAEGRRPVIPSALVVTHWEDGVEETLTFLNEDRVL